MGDVADTLLPNVDRLVRAWTAEVEKASSAKGLSPPECEGMIRPFLEALAHHDPSAAERAEAHIALRLRQGFELADIVDELGALARSASKLWAALPPGMQPDPVAMERFYGELHRTGARAAQMFERHMFEDEQRDKRYERRLEALAHRKLASPDASPERFSEELAIVLEAASADAAAIVALAGTPPSALDVAGEPRIAATLETLPWDRPDAVEPTGDGLDSRIVDAPGALVALDVRSLLVTRMPPGDGRRLALVLARAGRELTARDVRRVELLAERLAWHLDRARLHADLRRTVEALRTEQRVRDRFVAILAHDLRGPIATAKTAAELLVAEDLAASVRMQSARRIERALARADRMLRDLLDVHMLRAGRRLSPTLAPCDLAELARAVADELAVVYGSRFVVGGDERVEGRFSCDDVHRAIWNLAHNAVKYGASDAPVRLDVRRAADRALVRVHNRGRPIPRERQAHLFDAFTRLDAPSDGSMRGWGLGLTLVRGCAEAHGGRVEVESDAERGTTFTLELPLDTDSAGDT